MEMKERFVKKINLYVIYTILLVCRGNHMVCELLHADVELIISEH